MNPIPVLELELNDAVIGKLRPRYSSITGGFYSPKANRDMENILQELLAGAYPSYVKEYRLGKAPTWFNMIPVRLELTCLIKWEKKFKNLYPPKPDIDNVVKTILDSYNQNPKDPFHVALYQDDVQVVEVEATKQWHSNNRTIIRFLDVSLKHDKWLTYLKNGGEK